MTRSEFYIYLIAIYGTIFAVMLWSWWRARLRRKGDSLAKDDFERFRKKAEGEGLNKPMPPDEWFFASLVQKDTGAFACGIFVQAQGWMKAVELVVCRDDVKDEDLSVHQTVPVPADQLPSAEYLDRALTLEEVRSVWPWVKA